MKTQGQMLRRARVGAGLSLRQVADALGWPHVYLGEIERGKRAVPERHWPAVIALLPSLTIDELRAAAAQYARHREHCRCDDPAHEAGWDALATWEDKHQELRDAVVEAACAWSGSMPPMAGLRELSEATNALREHETAKPVAS